LGSFHSLTNTQKSHPYTQICHQTCGKHHQIDGKGLKNKKSIQKVYKYIYKKYINIFMFSRKQKKNQKNVKKINEKIL
jgi:hypothetical protein